MYSDAEMQRLKEKKDLAKWSFVGGLIVTLLFYIAPKLISLLWIVPALIFSLFSVIMMVLTFVAGIITLISFVSWIAKMWQIRLLS